MAQICSFHGLASFYRRFIRNFSFIMVPITDLMRNKNFVWTTKTEDAFLHIKMCLPEASCLALPDFEKLFEVEMHLKLELVLSLFNVSILLPSFVRN